MEETKVRRNGGRPRTNATKKAIDYSNYYARNRERIINRVNKSNHVRLLKKHQKFCEDFVNVQKAYYNELNHTIEETKLFNKQLNKYNRIITKYNITPNE